MVTTGHFFRLMVIARLLSSMASNSLYCKIGDKLVYRAPVPAEKKSWSVDWPHYKPNSAKIDFGDKPWADPDIDDANFHPKWNQMDGKVNRQSHEGPYRVVNGYPLNPLGRTGVCLRGKLGRWGPNHAADPIVTRWKRNEQNQVVTDSSSNKQILQFVAIQRRDTSEWALPGGMVDPDEDVKTTVRREFFEEALNSFNLDKEKKQELENRLKKLFDRGVEVYRGCVDDPRNTDNAWMETVAFNFHDDDDGCLNEIRLNAGDDAKNVRWIDVDKSLKLYANHSKFIFETATRLKAHW